jgi:hypothetical protein
MGNCCFSGLGKEGLVSNVVNEGYQGVSFNFLNIPMLIQVRNRNLSRNNDLNN